MKKFSNVTGDKINDAPIENNQYTELDIVKVGILKLMDNYLSIRSNGSARTELLMSSLKITGKEMFVEALLELMGDSTLKDQIKALESLKSENKDWKSIDSKINEITNKNKLNENQIKKIKTFLDTYSDDERFIEILDAYASRIKSVDEAKIRSITSSGMINNSGKYSKSKLSQISERFMNRAKELEIQNGKRD